MQSYPAASAYSLQPGRRCWHPLTGSCRLPNSSNPAPETPCLYFPVARTSLRHFHSCWMWSTSRLPPAHFPSPPDFPGSSIVSSHSVTLTHVMGNEVFAFSHAHPWNKSKEEGFFLPSPYWLWQRQSWVKQPYSFTIRCIPCHSVTSRTWKMLSQMNTHREDWAVSHLRRERCFVSTQDSLPTSKFLPSSLQCCAWKM